MKLKRNIAISDSGFLFNPSTGDSYSLNPIGIEMLKHLQENTSDELIIAAIIKEYMVDKSTVERDLYDFKQMLGNYKLIE